MFVLTLSNNNNNNSNNYLYSYDGKNWTDISNSSLLTKNMPNKVKWTGSQFHIAGDISTSDGNTLLKSHDGIHYTPLKQKTEIPPLQDIESNLEFQHTITFPRNMTIALGGSPADSVKIAYSLDEGLTWNPSTNSSAVFTEKATNACWNGLLWVATGKGGNSLATSTDGIQWIGRGSYIFSTGGECICWNSDKGYWLAGGSGTHSLATSYDGVYWSSISNPLACIKDILWNGHLWVATGIPDPSTPTKSVIYSQDGRTWKSPDQTDLFDIHGNKISWNGSFWTIIGSSQSNQLITTSNDGIHWNVQTASKQYTDIVFTNNQTFLLDGSSISKEENNIIDLTDKINQMKTLLYNGSHFLIGGEGIIQSRDGSNWTTSQNITEMSVIQKLAWNHPYRGTPKIKPLTIALGEGENTIGYSEDGIYWNGLGNQVFGSRGNQAVWNGTLWVAVGAGNFWVATSYDGIQWVGRDNSIMGEGLDVAWNGSVFIAVGYGGTYKMAASRDGIEWYGLPYAENIFTEKASAITWTGKCWLAYGSGENTTAVSYSTEGWIWETTQPRNQVLLDASSIYTTCSPTISSSSVYSESYEVIHVFDVSNSNLGEWRSVAAYDSSGNYTGSSGEGEWVQMDLSGSQRVIYYNIIHETDASGSIPKSWKLLGSEDEITWDSIDIFENIDPSSTITIRNVYNNTSSYKHYRIVFLSNNGGEYVAVSKIELFIENENTTRISPRIKPIITRTHVLYQNNISATGATNYQIADLYGNVVVGKINGGYTSNQIIDGSQKKEMTSVCFDGQDEIATTMDGNIYALLNDALNTNQEFIKTTRTTNQTNVLTSCFNGQRIMLGGTGGSVISYSSPLHNGEPNFHASLNGSQLFQQVNGLASNSGYGFVSRSNALYLNPSEQISIVAPKSYDNQIVYNTINMSLHNSANYIYNVVLPPTSLILGLLGHRGPKGHSDRGPTGPLGPIGPKGTRGYTGITYRGETGAMGQQGWVGSTGETGQRGPIGEKGLLGFQGIVGSLGPTGEQGMEGHTGEKGPTADGQWRIDASGNLTGGQIGIGVMDMSGILDISGNVHIIGNMIQKGNMNIVGSLNTQRVMVGKTYDNNVVNETVLDISGDIFISKELLIQCSSPSDQYQLDVSGNINTDRIIMNKMEKKIGEPIIIDNSNIRVDYGEGDEYYLDVGIMLTENYKCIVENGPNIENGMIEMMIINDYSHSTMDRYYCNKIRIKGVDYEIQFNGGEPRNLSTKFKQNIRGIIINSVIQKIICNITNLHI